MNWKLHLRIALIFLLALTISGLSTAQEIDPYSSSNDAFTINVDLPQAVVQDLTVTDTLPQGLIYKSDSLEIIGTQGSPFETVSSPNDGSQPVSVTWTFDQVDNSADQDILLRFQPIVADVATNTDGETLAASRVSLQFTDDFGEIYTASGEIASVKLVEPDLEIAMSCSPDGGKTVACSASIGHAFESHADAYGTDLSILLPAGTIYSPGSAEVVSAPPGLLDDTNPQELKMHFDGIDRSWNKDHMILLKFQATTEDGAAPEAISGEIKANLVWKSAPGDNPGTRSYIKTQSIPIPEYVPSYSLSINSVAEPDPVEAGQSLLYTIDYANTGQDDVHGVTIEETFDRNATYLSAIPMPDEDREDLWTVGDLLAGESGTIKLAVRVNPDSADGTILRNSVKMSSAEYATAEAITETTVKGKPDKLTTKASSNSTNSSLIENENKTASQDILQNNTENATAAIISINDTKADSVYISLDNVTKITNTTTSINQSDALVNLTAEAEDSMVEAGNLSETGGDLPGETVIQLNETADESSETLDEANAFEQVEQNAEDDVDTIADLMSLIQYTVAELTVATSESDPAIDQSDALLNPTARAEDLLAGTEAGSQSETVGDLPGEAANQNEIADTSSEILDEEKAFEQIEQNVEDDVDAKADLVSLIQDTVAELTDATSKSNPAIDQSDALSNPTAGVENSLAGTEAGIQSETGGDLPGETANQNEIADTSSEILDEEKAFEQIELNVKNDVYTISFGDGINVDIVFDKSNPMMEKTYVVLNETGEGSNGDFNSIDQRDAAQSNATSNSEPVTNQTDIEINKTEAIKILPGNESEKGIDLPIVSDNETDISADPAIAVEGASDEPEEILLPVDSGPDQALNQPADEENPEVESAGPPVAADGISDEPEQSPLPLDSGPDQALNQPAVEENLLVESVDTPVAVDGASDEPEQSSLLTDSGTELAIIQPASEEKMQAPSQSQTAAEENLQADFANQYPLVSVELPSEPPINETEVANA